ncbi:MAG: 30S ribosomal protein S16 [Deltaproteobacteria bacterium]|nr:30S ribosomal protein S16 [Deltaproteobacteria bacterium]
MAVRIRLARIGSKKKPFYRIIVTNSENINLSNHIEQIGFYNPRAEEDNIRVDLEKFDSWIKKGAKPTDTVASLVRKVRKINKTA